jgi:putative ABC transport system permease protein
MTIVRTELRALVSRPARALLTSLAIVVAAGFAYGAMVLNHVLQETVLNELSNTAPGATAVVESADAPLAPETLRRIGDVPGVVATLPRIEVSARVVGVPGDQPAPRWRLVADPGQGPLSRVTVVEGRYPRASGEIAVGAATARRAKLRVGDRLVLAARDGRRLPVTVVGIVEAPGEVGSRGYAPARWIQAAYAPEVHRVDVRASGDVLPALRSVAGPDARVRDAQAVRTAEAYDAIDGVEQMMIGVALFVLVAVIAAVLVTASVFRIVFAQRMRQLALLRAMGAGRGRLIGALVVEGGVVGLLGGALGVTAAQLIAWATAGSSVLLGGALACVLGAMVVTAGTAVAPAIVASRVSPVAALRASAAADGGHRVGWLRILLGVALIAAAGLAAAGSLLASGAQNGMLLVVISGGFGYGAVLAHGPLLVRPLTRVVGWPAWALSRVSGRLAVRNTLRAPRRVAAVTAVVTLGVTLVTGLLVVVGSARAQAEDAIASEYPTDFTVHSGDPGGIPDQVVRRLAGSKELGVVAPVRHAEATLTAGAASVPAEVTSVDVSAVPSLAGARAAGGGPSDVAAGQMGLHQSVADQLGAVPGGRVTVRIGGRSATLVVAAVWQRFFYPVLIQPADFAELAPDAPASTVLIDRARGHSHERALAAVKRVLTGDHDLAVASARETRRQRLEPIEQFTYAALGLLALTVVIAVVGVATTMSLSALERTAESGLLRALGMSRGGLRLALLIESGMYGLVGSAIGLALGIGYAALAITSAGLGMAVTILAPPVAGAVSVLVLLTVMAGVFPAHRAAQVSPVAALGATG